MTNAGASRSNTANTLTTIVEEISNLEGVEPTELRPPLYDVIDPDALSAVFAATESGNSREGGRIEFTYCGYEVVVQGDGQVTVDGSRRR